MKLLVNLLVGLLIAAPTAFGISRIGNGSLQSDTLGFSILPPQHYSLLQSLGPESVRLLDPNSAFSNFGRGLDMLDIRDFVVEYPEFQKKSIEELRDILISTNWSVDERACFTVYKKLSQSTQTTIVHWGKGLGVVLIGELSPSKNLEMQKMIESFRLTRGDCQWK